MAFRWHQENPNVDPESLFCGKQFPGKKVSNLPKQNNYCDCGLFTLTYIHFFASYPPVKLNFKELESVGGKSTLPTLARASMHLSQHQVSRSRCNEFSTPLPTSCPKFALRRCHLDQTGSHCFKNLALHFIYQDVVRAS